MNMKLAYLVTGPQPISISEGDFEPTHRRRNTK